ncbi:hypothetical protein [Luteolibacter soli]|uniref:DUF4034 domain-containing protein n=1 Tax=Luteolibacter soli TaxID=3135280 RepID=A0ABU9AYV9_9BACT
MRAKSAAVFLATCAVTAIGWIVLWPGTPAEPVAAAVPEPAAKPWRRDELDALVAAIENAKSDGEKLQAALRLERIPSTEILSALSSIQTTRDGELTLSAKALLIRWASQDPEAAIAWAWQEFRSKPAWKTAFQQIGPAWAWRDPEGLKAWTLAQLEARPPDRGKDFFDDYSIEQAKNLDAPGLKFADLNLISGWLLREDPKLGMEVFLKRGGFSSHDDRWEDTLTDPRLVERAMQAFPPEMIEVLKTRDATKPFTLGPETHAQTLLRLWRKLDPDGFRNSSYVSYLPENSFEAVTITAKEWAEVPADQREKAAQEKLASVSERQRPSSATIIAKEWATTDPAACRAWIESLSGKDASWATSEYVRGQAASSLTETLDWVDRFDPERRGEYLVQAFDIWLKANPESQPDFSGWSESRRQTWSDLVALTKLGTP